MNELQLDKINIEDYIFEVRGQKVMLANDLAKLYSVETRYINQIVKRNIKRFSESYCFQLTQEECANLRRKIFTSSYGGRRYFETIIK